MSSSSAAQGLPPAVAQLATQLEQATSEAELLGVVRALGSLGQVEGIPLLIRAFGFNRPAVGEAALEEVLRFGEAAVQPLLANIDGFDYGARAYSVRALARIGHGDAYPFLVEAIVADFAPACGGQQRAGWDGWLPSDPCPIKSKLCSYCGNAWEMPIGECAMPLLQP